MSRSVLAAGLSCLLVLPAAAQDVEKVTVYGGSLSGFWHVIQPSWLQINLFGKVTWGPLIDRICRVTSATAFHGHFGAKLMGIVITDPDVSEGNKIALDPAAPDVAGKAGLLRPVLNGEAVPHDPKLDETIAAARAGQPGALQQIIYLGLQAKGGGPTSTAVPDYFAAYAVEYADSERLCWLHQDDDGKLAAFQCA